VRRIYREDPTPTPQRIALKPSEAAKVLGISAKTLWTVSQPRGTLPCVRIGSRVTYFIHHLQKWADSQLAEQAGAGREVTNVG
jgi:predicted DNA-binding transcriptional regulator AlpA